MIDTIDLITERTRTSVTHVQQMEPDEATMAQWVKAEDKFALGALACRTQRERLRKQKDGQHG